MVVFGRKYGSVRSDSEAKNHHILVYQVVRTMLCGVIRCGVELGKVDVDVNV